jgi:hypothetical protein
VYVAIPFASVTFADETVVTLRPARDHETAAPATGRPNWSTVVSVRVTPPATTSDEAAGVRVEAASIADAAAVNVTVWLAIVEPRTFTTTDEPAEIPVVATLNEP